MLRLTPIRPLDKDELKRYKLLSLNKRYKSLVDRTKDVIAEISDKGNFYLSCSFGKDSIVLYDLVSNVIPDIAVTMIDDGVSYLDIDYEMITDYSKSMRDFIKFNWNKLDFMNSSENPYSGNALHTDMFYPIIEWLKDNPKIGFFMGLRKQESTVRKISIFQHGVIHQYKTGKQVGMWRGVPLQDWTVDDIGAYTVSNNLPILDIYKKMGFEARSGLFGLTNAHCGRIAYLRRFYPQKYEQLIALFPNARSFT